MNNISFTPCFADESTRPDNGKNCHELELNHLTKLLLTNYESFSLSDFLSLSRSLDIPASEVLAFFAKFTARKVKEKQITEENGCYNQPVFRVTSLRV